MAGPVKKNAPKSKVAEKAPVAPVKVEPKIEAKPAPKIEPKIEAKPAPKVEPKIEAKAAPKIEPKIEAKPAPKIEPKIEAKPAPKIEPKPAPKPVPHSIATLTFDGNWKVSAQGNLIGGGQVIISYDPSRAHLRHSHNGAPAWGVQAFVKMVPSGQVVEQPVVDFEDKTGQNAKARPFSIDLPKGTTELQVWFKNWTGADHPAESWDSDFGKNYRFATRL